MQKDLIMYKNQLKHGGNIFAPGEYGIDNEVYHASVGISRSGISEFKKSPLHYWEAYINPSRVKKEATKAMIFGEAVHTIILEPDLFNERFAVSEKFDGRTNAGKSAKAQFELANQGKKILNIEDYFILEHIQQEIIENKIIKKLLKNAKIERSLFWMDSETELLCKARPDSWSNDYLADIKTTSDSTYNEFYYSVRKYNYHIQAAMQIDAIKEITGVLHHNFIFIAIQTSPPYKPYLYNLGDVEIEYGRKEYKNILKVFRACFDKNDWGADRDCVTEINLPSYFFNEQNINNLMEVYNV